MIISNQEFDMCEPGVCKKGLCQSACNSMLLFAIAVPGGHKQQNKAAAGLITAAGAY